MNRLISTSDQLLLVVGVYPPACIDPTKVTGGDSAILNSESNFRSCPGLVCMSLLVQIEIGPYVDLFEILCD